MEEDAKVVDAVAEELPDVPEHDPEDFKPAARDLVVTDADELWRVLDRHDEAMILDELQRRALEVMLYDFGDGGSRKIGLSYGGVLECIRLMNYTGKLRIKVDPQSLQVSREDTDEGLHYVARVYAQDEVTGGGQFGVAKQPAYMKLKKKDAEGKPIEKWDIFAETKAVSKAQRNALEDFIPIRIRETIIAMWVGDEARVKRIAHGPVTTVEAELPPPATGEAADELRLSIRALYDRIKNEVDGGRLKLTPAQFDLWLRQADHSEERLADFRDHLQQRLEEWTAVEGGVS